MNNRKQGKILSLALILMVLLSSFSMLTMYAKAEPNIIYVDDSNINDPHEDGSFEHSFDKIQEGIDAANPGDIVSVESGSYYEDPTINKSLILIGKGRFYTNIYSNSFYIFTIEGTSKVKIQGIAIYGGYDSTGIVITKSTLVTIDLNYIGNCFSGINIDESSSCTITENLIVSSGGIPGYHVNSGILLSRSSNMTIYENVITDTQIGIELSMSNANKIRNNKLLSHVIGIKMQTCNLNNITENLIEGNTIGLTIGGDYNNVYHNNFVDNSNVDAHIDGTNTFDNDYPSGGNFWSNYTDTDVYNGPDQDILDPDGIWDHPYQIYEDNIDNYPLTKPYIPGTFKQPPVAYIDSISPNPAYYDHMVNFEGHGEDSDGIIVEYRWTSSIDGFLSSLASFGTAPLSLGEHEISFEVKDDDGVWSTAAKTTLVIKEWTLEPEVIIDVYTDRDELHENLNEVEITITVENVGTYTARDVTINLELPYNFETKDPTSWIRYIEPDEELTFNVVAKANRCVPGTFEVTGNFKDRENNIIDIPTETVPVNLKEIILLEYSDDPPYTDVNLSPEWVEMAKSWSGAEEVAAAIWVMTLLEKAGIEEVKLETVLEHLDEVYYFIQYLLEMEEPDYTILPMLIDVIGGIAINTVKLWIDARGYGDVFEDGTMDYHAIWPIETFSWFMKEVAKIFIDMLIDKIKEGIPTIKRSKYIVFLQDPAGKLYLDITGLDNVSIYEVEGMSLAFVEPLTGFDCYVNGTDAKQNTEEYTVTYLAIVDGSVSVKWSETFNITKGQTQRFKFQLNDTGGYHIIGPLVVREEVNMLTYLIYVTLIAIAVIVAILLITLARRKKPEIAAETETEETKAESEQT